MKHKLMLVLVAPLLLALSAFGADNWWTDLSVSPFGVVNHPDFGKPVWGSGIDVGYNINKTVSLHVANLALETCDWGGSVIDETSLLFRADLIKYSKERFVGYLIGSGDRGWGSDDWAFGVGIGAELRLAKNVSLGVDSRIRSWFKQDKDLQTRGYFSLRF